MRAIELNGVAGRLTARRFDWGRRAAHDLEAVRRVARRRPAQSADKTARCRRTSTS